MTSAKSINLEIYKIDKSGQAKLKGGGLDKRKIKIPKSR